MPRQFLRKTQKEPPIMVNRTRKDSMNFMALKKLHAGQKCNPKIKYALKRMNLIELDLTLTPNGKEVLYAGILGISTTSTRILSVLYVQKKTQIQKKNSNGYKIPVPLQLLKDAVFPLSESMIYTSIKQLNEKGMTMRVGETLIMITDSAYDGLVQYDVDLSHIERSLFI